MFDLYREINFEDEIAQAPGLDLQLQIASREIAEKISGDFVKKPFYDTQFNTLIIVCDLPKVPKEKLQVLDKVLVEKLLGAIQLSSQLVNAHYSFQENKIMTNGSAIFEFNSAENAILAAEKLNGVVLDKNHTLKVYTMEDFEKIMGISEEYSPPKVLPKADLQKWLLDKELRDQYCVLATRSGGLGNIWVNWFDHLEKKPVNAIEGGKELLDIKEGLALDWSTNGSYLITLEKNV